MLSSKDGVDRMGNCAQESGNCGKKLGVSKADLNCRSDSLRKGVLLKFGCIYWRGVGMMNSGGVSLNMAW